MAPPDKALSSRIARLASHAASLSLAYALFAGLWVVSTDWLLGYLIDDPNLLLVANNLKGIIFVGVTSLLLYGLMRRAMRRNIEGISATAVPDSRVVYWSIAAATLLVLLTGGLVMHEVVERRIADRLNQLQAIARLKTDEISRWLDERRRDSGALHASPLLSDALLKLQQGEDPALRSTLTEQLEGLRVHMGYQAVSVMDRHGNCLLCGNGDGDDHVAPQLQQTLERACDSNRVQFSDMYRDTVNGAQHLHVDFVVPLETGGQERPRLALVLRLDQKAFLFPFLQDWPLPSDSAEALLFKPDGDGVLFLNELRFRPDSALKLRIPLTASRVLAVQVADGRVRPGQPVFGVDYRGVPSVGVARMVSGTSWCLIAKMDRDELYGRIKADLFLIGLVLALALTVTVAGGVLLRQRQQLRWKTVHNQDLAERLRLQEDVGRAREQRRALLSHYDTLIAKARDIVLLVDADGRLVEANEAAVKAYGRPVHALRGMPFDRLFAATSRDDYQRYWQATTAPDGVLFEAMQCAADGTCFPVEVSARVIEIAGKSYRQCFIRDISERTQAEQALRDSEARLRRAVQESPFPMLMHAEDGEVLMVSEAWTRLTGYRRSDMPTIAAWTALAYGEHKEAVQRDIAALYALEGRSDEGEYHVHCHDGSERLWQFSSVSLGRLPDGRRTVLSMAADVTERENVARELRQRNAELERFNRVAVGRELDMIALKRQVNSLSRELGRAPPYPEPAQDRDDPAHGKGSA